MSKISDMLTIKTNNITPGRGKLLISEPFLLDYYFKRSVVLLAEHNEEGSFGVIMNKPVNAKFNDIVKDFPEFDANLFLGGPVKTESLFFLHTVGDKIENSMEVLEGLYWGGDIEQVKEMITLKLLDPDDVRFYVGYSGWGANQLNGELERNSWVVAGTNRNKLMFTDPAELWSSSLKNLGKEYELWLKFPADPGAN
jgi:putative transcriptional regulator